MGENGWVGGREEVEKNKGIRSEDKRHVQGFSRILATWNSKVRWKFTSIVLGVAKPMILTM